ncbi:MAG TPA: zf-HC2 domain-containing protein [Gemmatimonadaceae bacterium]|nr:zf-HC2 domain-containing protein [Gemmatimonadaceae bacterium]
MRHLDEGTIHAWLDGALSEEQERQAESHAARCTPCAVAVADARGLIAASSRILSALDDVPSGVLPAGSRATPSPRAPSAPLAPRPRGEPRRWTGWPVRIAASIAVVATGTILVLRNGAPTMEDATRAKAPSPLPPGITLQATPAEMPDTTGFAGANAPSAADEKKANVAGRLGEAPSGGAVSGSAPAAAGERDALAAKAEQKPAAAAQVPAAPAVPGASIASNEAMAAGAPAAAPAKRLAPDSESLRQLDSGVATRAPKMKVQQQGPPAPPSAQMADMARATVPASLRLVSEQQDNGAARLVVRRVYEVRPGLEVTLAMVAPPAAPRAARAESAESASDSGGGARRADEPAPFPEEQPGVNSIEWSDSAGTRFRLSGPLPLDSLRSLRARLPGPPIRQR